MFITTPNFIGFVAILFYIANILSAAIIEYISSIFFRAKMFINKTIIDYYSSYTDTYLYWVRFLCVTFQLLLSEYNQISLEIVIYPIYPLLVFLLIENRISRGVHIHIIGAFLKDSPLFISPLILFFNAHPKPYINIYYLATFLLILYLLLFYFYQIFLKKYSYLILNGKYEAPWYLPISNSAIMRFAAEAECDIEGFENYMTHSRKQDPEEMIEVIRFLGIFKSQRTKITIILSKYKTNIPYYDFQFYLLQRVFQCYTETPPAYIKQLDDLHRSYLVCLSLFWNCRKLNEKYKSFVYAAKASFVHVELVSLSKYLILYYQYNPFILQSFAEIAMIALGDPSKSVTYHRLSQLANENPEMIDDPLLRYSFYNYPISVKRYNEEKGSTSSSSSSSSHSFFNWSYSKLRLHINENVIYRDEKSDNSPMAMFVQKYTDIKTYSLIISILLMLVWFLCFCYESYQSKCRFLVHFDHVKDSIHHMIKSIYLFSSYKMINNLNLTFKDCQKNVNFVYDFINGYNIQTNEDYYYVVNVLGYTSDMLSDYNCTFFANLDQKAKAKEIKKFYEAAFTEIKILLKDSPMSTFKKYFKLLSVFSTLYAFLSIFYLYLNVSYTFMWLPKKAIDFLSSRERLALLLLKKSLESWDLFKIYFPNENLKNEAEVIKKIDKPVVKQKSHHLNLTDSKLFVSFIGNYEQIDSSTFALMKPSYEEEIEKHTDNYLNEIDTMKGRRCSDSLDFERTDLNLNRRKSLNNIFTFNSKVDLVAKTIEETELNSLKVYYRFLIIYYAPWLAMLFIFFISRLTIFFVIDQTETYFNHILELLGQLTSQFKTPSNPSFYIRELEDLLSSDDLVSVNTLALNSTIIVGLILLIIALYMI